jgi:hypothetical protein
MKSKRRLPYLNLPDLDFCGSRNKEIGPPHLHRLNESDKNKINSFRDVKNKTFRRQSLLALRM